MGFVVMGLQQAAQVPKGVGYPEAIAFKITFLPLAGTDHFGDLRGNARLLGNT